MNKRAVFHTGTKVSVILAYLIIMVLGTSLASTGTPLVSKNSSPEEEFIDRYATAQTLFYDGEFAIALQHLENLEGKVDQLELGVWQAKCHQMLGDNQTAIRIYASLIKSNPEVFDLRLELAQLLMHSNEPD